MYAYTWRMLIYVCIYQRTSACVSYMHTHTCLRWFIVLVYVSVWNACLIHAQRTSAVCASLLCLCMYVYEMHVLYTHRELAQTRICIHIRVACWRMLIYVYTCVTYATRICIHIRVFASSLCVYMTCISYRYIHKQNKPHTHTHTHTHTHFRPRARHGWALNGWRIKKKIRPQTRHGWAP